MTLYIVSPERPAVNTRPTVRALHRETTRHWNGTYLDVALSSYRRVHDSNSMAMANVLYDSVKNKPRFHGGYSRPHFETKYFGWEYIILFLREYTEYHFIFENMIERRFATIIEI